MERAAISWPLAAELRQDGADRAVTHNLWVAPNGRWVGPYVPAMYRSYPFLLARTAEDRRALCIRQDSGLISETEGEPFFDADGNPAKPMQDVLNFLELLANNTQQTAALCAMLAAHKIIQPWNIQVKAKDDEQTLKGLFRIDEAAFNALPDEAFQTLRKAGALPVVYCQLLSMQHIQTLGKLVHRHAQAAAITQQPEQELDLEFLKDGDNIRFH